MRSVSLARAARWLLPVLASAAVGCASTRARPRVLDEAALASRTPQAIEANETAHASFAEAEALRRHAEQAFQGDDPAAAQILAEQAIVAYQRAFIHARTLRATRMGDEAQTELGTADAELARLRDEQTRGNSEVADLEARIKVVRDAMPLAVTEVASAVREAARLEAARALVTEARLLCVATRMLAPDTEGLKEAEASLAEITPTLLPRTRPAPVDAATRVRSQCLSALTAARRAQSQATPAPESVDALLADLSREGSFAPVRDERGVVVTVHDAFAAKGVSASATPLFALAGKIAAAHPSLPLLIVLHDAEEPGDRGRDDRRADAVKKLLAPFRTDGVLVVLAGATRPVVDAKRSKDRGRNERVELVFVDRGSPGGS